MTGSSNAITSFLKPLFAVAFVFFSLAGYSQTFYSAGSGGWNAPGSWTLTSGTAGGAGVPGPGDVAIIERGHNITGNSTTSILTLQLGGSSADGSGTLTMSTAGVTLTVTGNVVVGGNTNMRNGVISFTSTGTLAISTGNITIGNALGGSGSVSMTNGVLSVGGSILLAGAGNTWSSLGGEVRMTGTSTLPATLLSTFNFLNVQGNVTLGMPITIGPTLTVTGTLDVGAHNVLDINALNMTGGTINGSGSLQLNGVGTVTTSGSVTASTINAPIDLNGTTRIFSVSNGGAAIDLSVTSVISGAAGISKTGSGVMQISGANTYTTTTTIGLGGTLRLGAAGSIPDLSAVTITGATGTLDLNGFSEEVGSITNSGVITNSGAGSATLTCGGSNANTTFSGTITTAVGLTKTGTGTLILSGINTHTGVTTIDDGTLTLSNASALGTVTGGTVVSSGGVLNLNGQTIAVAEPLTLNGAGTGGGALVNNAAGLATYSGSVTLGSASTIGAGTGAITIAGDLSGGLNLTKIGAQNLSFTTNPVTVGNLVISAGTLVSTSGTLSLSGSFTNSGTFTHNSGTVDYNGTAPQSVVVESYYNLALSNTGVKTAAGNLAAANSTDNGGSANTATTLDMIGFTLTSPTIENTNGTIKFSDVGNGLAVSTGTIEYYGAAQTVTNGTYNNLVLSNSGVKTAGGAIVATTSIDNGGASNNAITLEMGGFGLTSPSIENTNGLIRFSGASNGVAVSTGTVEYYGGAQSIGAGNYGTLLLFNTGPKTAAGGITATTSLDNGGPSNNPIILNMGIFPLVSPSIENTSATIQFSGSNGIPLTTGTIEYTGSFQPVASGTYNHLKVSSTTDAFLTGATTSQNALTINTGRLILGSNNLVVGVGSVTIPSPSSSNMIVASGGGSLALTYTGPGTYTFPIGDNTGAADYSPIDIAFASVGVGAIRASVVDAKHPSNFSSSNFITRYWEISQSGLSGPATVTGTYVGTDLTGSAAIMRPAHLNGTFDATTNPWEVYTASTPPPLTATGITTISSSSVLTGVHGTAPTVSIDQGATANLCNGSSLQLTTTAAGNPALTYAWSTVGGGTISSTTISNPVISPTANDTYTVTVRDGNGVVATDNIIITVIPAPTLTGATQAAAVCVGSGAVINLTGLVPSTTITVSYSINGVAQAPATPIVVAGAGTASFTSAALTAANNGQSLQITGIAIVSATPNCTAVFAQNVLLTIQSPAAITVQPVAVAACETTTVQFSVTATGTSVTYQWQEDNGGGGGFTNITNGGVYGGATTNTLTLTGITLGMDQFKYRAVVGNGAIACIGSFNSLDQLLTVKEIPDASASNVSICDGQSTNIAIINPNAVVGVSFTWTVQSSTNVTGASGNTGALINQSITSTDGINPGTVVYSIVPSAVGCVGSPFAVSATVNPLPVLSSANSIAAICSGSPISYTPTSSTPAAAFSWSRAGHASITPAGAGSGTGSISETLNNTSTADVTVNYTYTVSAGGCTNGTTFNVSHVVKPIPVSDISLTPAAICSGATFAYTPSSATASMTYTWSRAAVTGITSPGPGSGNNVPISEVLNNTTPTPLTVTYKVIMTANGCTNGPAGQDVVITVAPVPAAVDPANQVVCDGASTAAINFAGVATSYIWTNDDPSIGLSGGSTGNIGSFTATNTGTTAVTATITVTPRYTVNGVDCDGADQTFTITVNPTPEVNAAAPIDLCSGGTVGFTPTGTVAGSTFSWSSSVSGVVSGVSAVGTGAITDVLINTSGVVATVTYTIVAHANGCSGPGEALVVQVDPRPVITSSGNATICSDDNTAITISSATVLSSGSVVYNYTAVSSHAGLTGFSSGTDVSLGTPIADNLDNGTSIPQTVTYTITPHGVADGGDCFGTPIVVVITVAPVPAAVDPANQVVCDGASTAAINFAGVATSYIWTNDDPSIGLSGGSTGNIGSFTATNTGTTAVTATITVTPRYTVNGVDCDGADQTFTITVNPTPEVNAAAPIDLCSGGTVGFTPTGTVAGSTFSWSSSVSGVVSGVSAVGTGAITDVLINTSGVVATVTYTIVAHANGCSGPGEALVVQVDPRPVITSSGNATICSDDNTAITISSATVLSSGSVVYNYTAVSSHAGLTGFSSGTDVSLGTPIADNLDNGTSIPQTVTYTITPHGVADGGDCFGTPIVVVITVAPVPAAVVPANQVVCDGASTAAINFAGVATSYIWTNDDPSIGLSGGSTGNIGSFTATNTGTTAVTATITVTPRYTVNGVDCDGADQTFTITVNPTPEVNAAAPIDLCSGGTVGFTPTGTVAGSTFSWSSSVSGVVSGVSAVGTGAITDVLINTSGVVATVTYTIVAHANGCSGPGEALVVQVDPRPVITSSGNATICSDDNTAITISSATVLSSGSVVYNYTAVSSHAGLTGFSSGTDVSLGTPIADNLDNGTSIPQTVTYTITPHGVADGGDCFGTPIVVVITVAPVPAAVAPANQVVCDGASTAAINFAGVATSYIWTNDDPSIGLSGGSTGNIGSFTATNTGTTAVTATITVTPRYTVNGVDCDGADQTFTITVNPTPEVNAAAPIDLCSGGTVGFTPTGTVAGSTFSWSSSVSGVVSGVSAVGTGAITDVLINTSGVVATVTYTIVAHANGCSGPGEALVVQVDPRPVITSSGNATICSDDNTAITISSATVLSSGSVVYNYTAVSSHGGLTGFSSGTDVSLGTPIADNLDNGTSIPQTVTYTITPHGVADGGDCFGTPIVVVITVAPVPAAVDPANQVVCDGASTAAINFAGVATSYIWTNDDPSIGLSGGSTGNIGSFTATNTGTTAVTATITVTPRYTVNGVDCDGADQTFTITVNPTPEVNAAAPIDLCSGGTVGFTPTGTVAGSTFSWSSSVSGVVSGVSAVGTGAITDVLINTSGVVATVTYTIVAHANGCSGPGEALVVQVDPRPVITSSGNATICSDDNTAITISSATVLSSGSVVYNYTAVSSHAGLTGFSSGTDVSLGTPIADNLDNGTSIPQTVTYTITPHGVADGGDCFGTPIVVVITVAPVPAAVDPANQVVCDGASTAAINFAGVATSYIWTNDDPSIGLSGGSTGNIGSFTATNTGTTAVTATITVTPRYTVNGVDCDGADQTFTITVNPTPEVNAAAPIDLCSGGTVGFTPTGTVAGSTFSWSSSVSGVVSGVSAVGTGAITDVLINTSGVVATVTYTIVAHANGCSGPGEALVVQVDPRPVITSSGNATICSDDNTAITISSATVLSSGSVVYNYTAVSSHAGLTGFSSGTDVSLGTPIADNLDNGTSIPQTVTYTITPHGVADGGDCFGTPIVVVITVAPVPAAVVPANQVVCDGASTAAINFAGVATSYIWTNDDPSIGLSGGSTGNIGSFTATNTGTTAVTATITVTPRYTVNGVDCDGADQTFTITVNPTPEVNAAAPIDLCSGGTVGFTPTGTVAGSTFSWSSSVSGVVSGVSAVGTGAITDVLINTSGVVATVTYTIVAHANGCSGPGEALVVQVDPRPVITSSGNATICSDDNTAITISSATVLSSGSVVYNYTAVSSHGGLTGFSSGTDVSLGTPIADNLDNGTSIPQTVTYTITPHGVADGGDCFGTPIVVVITVAPVPAAVVPANQVVCNGASTAAINFAGVATSYIWTNDDPSIGLSGGSTGNIGSFTATNTGTTAVTATITVTPRYTVNGVDCDGADQTFTITVNPTPEVNAAAPIDLCSGGTVGFTPTGTVAGSTFSWSSSVSGVVSGVSAVGTGAITDVLINTSGVVATVTYTIVAHANGCSGPGEALVVQVDPRPVITSSGNATICSDDNTAITISSATVLSSGSVVYNYTAVSSHAGLTGFSSGTDVSLGTPIADNLDNGTSIPQTVTYTITPHGVADGGDCFGTPIVVVITVAPVPAAVVPANQVVCDGASTAAINFAGVATSYIWTNDDPSIGLSGGSTGNIGSFTATNTGTTAVTATITVTPRYTVNGVDCDGADQTFTITVNPTPEVNAAAPIDLCSGGTVGFTPTGTVAGSTFSWSSSVSGVVSGVSAVGTGAITDVLINTSGVVATVTYTIVAHANGCSGPGEALVVQVDPRPVITSSGNATICSDDNTAITISSATVLSSGSVVYNYTAVSSHGGLTGFSSGTDVSLGTPIADNLDNGTSIPQTVTYTITPHGVADGGDCFGTPIVVVITVAPVPAAVDPANQVVCDGASTAAINFAGVATSYIWTNDDPSIGLSGGSTGNIGSFTATNTGTTAVTATITVTPRYTVNGVDCDGADQTFTITVNPTPEVNAAAPIDLCSGGTVGFTPTGTVAGSTFSWSSSVSGVVSGVSAVGTGAITDVLINTSGVVATVTYTIVAHANGCSGPGEALVVQVDPRPVITSSGNATICSDDNTAITISSATVLSSGSVVYNYTAVSSHGGLTGFSSGTDVSLGTPIADNLDNGTSIPQTVTYTITPHGVADGGDCFGTPIVVVITVAPVPAAVAPANQVVCNGASTAAINFAGVATSYIWTNDDPSIGLSGGSTGNIGSFTATNTGTTAVTATITVTPRYTVNGVDCDGADQTFTITVNPTPEVNAAAPIDLCSGGTVGFTPTGTVAGSTFSWSSSVSGVVSGASAVGTGAITDVLINTSGVVATVTYTIVAHANGCSGPGEALVVQVDPRPVITSSGNATICSDDNTAITISSATVLSSGSVVYNYTAVSSHAGLTGFSSGTDVSLGTPIADNLDNGTSIPQTVTYTITPHGVADGGDCFGTPIVVVITVAPVPAAVAPANQVVCDGASTAAINFAGVATSYHWTNTNTALGLAAASGTGPIAPFTAVNAGTASVSTTITVTPRYTVNGVPCNGLPQSFTITVLPTPGISNLPAAASNICSGGSVGFTAVSGVAGTTFSWSATVTTGTLSGVTLNGTGATINDLLVNTTGTVAQVQYSIIPSAAGCAGPAEVLTVNVDPKPVITATPTNETICSSGTTAIDINSGTTMSSGSVVYDFTAVATGGVTGFTSVTNRSLGLNITDLLVNPTLVPQTVTYTVTPHAPTALGGNCFGSPIVVVITVAPVPSVIDPADQIVCNGAATAVINFSGNATSYHWTNNTPGIGLAASGSGNIAAFPAVNATATAVMATISVTPRYTVNGVPCNGTPQSFTITVNPTPDVAAAPAGPITLCSGSTTSIALSTPNLAAGTTYTWTVAATNVSGAGDGSGNTISQALTSTTGNTPGSVTYTITPTAAGCSGAPISVVVNIDPNPTLGVNSATFNVCNGGTPTIGLTNPNIVGGVGYIWTVVRTNVSGPSDQLTPVAAAAINTPLTLLTSNLPGSVVYTIRSKAANCTSAPQTVTVNVNPIPTAAATPPGPITLCSGSTTNIALSNPNSVSGTTYSWTIAATNVTGASIGSGATISQLLTSTTGNTSGSVTYTITPSAAGCNGPTATVTVNIDPNPTLALNNTTFTVCNGGTPTIGLSNPNTVASVGYIWTVSATNVSGASNQLTPVAAASINTALSLVTLNTPGSVVYTIQSKAANCTSAPQTVTVNVNPIPTVSAAPAGPITLCSGSTTSIALSNPNSVSGTTYSWTISATNVTGASNGGGSTISQLLTSTTGNTSGSVTYTITPSAAGCNGPTTAVTVNISPNPTLAVSNTTFTVCNGGTPTIGLTNPNTVAGAGYIWTVSATNVTGASNQPTPVPAPLINTALSLVTANTPGSVVYTIQSKAANCTSAFQIVTVNVNPIPTVSAAPGGPITLCSGSTTSIVLSNPNTVSGTTYSWTISATNVTGASAGGGNTISQLLTSTTGNTSGSVTYTITPSAAGCNGPTATVTVNIDPNPTLAINNTTFTVCNGGTPTIGLTNPNSVTSVGYIWTVALTNVTGAANQATPVSASAINTPLTLVTSNTPGSVVYTIQSKAANCSSAPQTVTVNINPIPTVAAAPGGPITLCSGSTTNIALSNPNSVSGTTFSWTISATNVTGASNGGGSTISQLLTSTSGNTPGSVTYTITPLAVGCNGPTTSVTVNIDPNPTLAINNTIFSICNGGTPTIGLSNPNIVAGVGYIWTVVATNVTGASNQGTPVSAAAINTALSLVTSNTPGSVVYTIQSKAANCTSSPQTVTVNITPIPDVLATPAGPITLCSGSTTGITLTNPNAVSGTVYNWTISGANVTGALNGGGNSISQVLTSTTGNTSGFVTYTITPSLAGCNGTPITVVVNIDPNPTLAINNTIFTICDGGTPTIALSNPNNVAGASYIWTVAATNVTGAGNQPIPVPAGSINTALTLVTSNIPGSVVYTVQSTASSCNSAAQTITVNINPVPNVNFSGTTTICSGATTSIMLSNPNSVAGTAYNWTQTSSNTTGALDGAGNVISQQLLSANGNTPGSVTYTIAPTAGGCVGAPVIVGVTINPVPTLLTDITAQELCEGQSPTINLSNPNGVSGAGYMWSISSSNVAGAANQPAPTVASAINTSLSLTGVATIGSLTYSVRATASGCVSPVENITVTVREQAVVAVPPSIQLCEPSDVPLNGTVSGGASIGLWSIVNGLGSLSATNVVTGPPIQANSSYAVDATDIGGTVTMRLTTNDPDGPSGLCQVAFADYTITLNRSAKVNAGPDLAQCADLPAIQLQGTTSYAPSGILWTKLTGVGTFSNDADPASSYSFASPSEINQTMKLRITGLDPDGAGPCLSVSDDMLLKVNPLPTVSYVGFPAGSPPQVAENSASFVLTGNQVGGLFTISPTSSIIAGTVQSPTDQVTFDPGLVTLGNNTVTYTYTDGNGCTDFDAQLVRVNPVTNVDFIIANAALNATQEWRLCANQGLVKLTGNPVVSSGRPPETRFHPDPDAPTGQLYGNPISIVFQGGDYYIDTDNLVSDTYFVRYTYKNEFDAITYKSSPVHILASPSALIQVANSCIKDAINFIDASTLPSTPFPASIIGWRWDFDDQSFSNIQNPSHGYITPKFYDIELTATTDQGCSGSNTKQIRVGDIPDIDFKWSAICNNESTVFSNLSTSDFSSIDQYSWDFGDGVVISGAPGVDVLGVTGTTGTFDNPNHFFTSFGTYDIKLAIQTNDGCNNSLQQQVFILPYSTVTLAADSVYREGFDTGKGGWIAESTWKEKPGASAALVRDSVRYSWTWGDPIGNNITPSSPGNKAWWTGRRVSVDPYPLTHPGNQRYLNKFTYFNSETSAVNGPCFNLTALTRPMVMVDYWSDAEKDRDGAVLQYSTDGGNSWSIVGALQGVEGKNWYNSSGIVGKPGNQSFGDQGWSDKSAKWVNARFHLDGIPYAERDQVRLRIAFGSEDANADPTYSYDGFAFDNFVVGDKTRNVLVEHFTNTATSSGETYLDALFQDQITKLRPQSLISDFHVINYHLNYPSPDPLNRDNAIDPAARALYMGVSRSPVTIMDGTQFNGDFFNLKQALVDRRALDDPQFLLKLDTVTLDPATVPNARNKLNPVLTITATSAFTQPLLVNVALIENNVGTAKNVLRKLLYGPDGHTVTNAWAAGGTHTVSRPPVEINVPITNPGQLTMIAWVQDKTTKEIYQSVVLAAPPKIGGVNVGVEDEPVVVTTLTGITVYPNPANGKFSFYIPGDTKDGFTWRLSDQRGIAVAAGTFDNAFDHALDVDVATLANGVYIVAISGPDGATVYEKLVIMNHH